MENLEKSSRNGGPEKQIEKLKELIIKALENLIKKLFKLDEEEEKLLGEIIPNFVQSLWAPLIIEEDRLLEQEAQELSKTFVEKLSELHLSDASLMLLKSYEINGINPLQAFTQVSPEEIEDKAVEQIKEIKEIMLKIDEIIFDIIRKHLWGIGQYAGGCSECQKRYRELPHDITQ